MGTLFYDADWYTEWFKFRYGLTMSPAFSHCANGQLTGFFERATGIKAGKHVSMTLNSCEWDKLYIRGTVSTFKVSIYVNHNWNDVLMCWKSKSGRIYEVGDEDVDCGDMEFWFEGLDPALYHRQLYPKAELPFKLKNLSYKLVVIRLLLNTTLNLTLREEKLAEWERIMASIFDFIERFNINSEKKDGLHGFVHQYQGHLEDGMLVVEFDLGSAGAEFFKRLLRYLSKMESFERVELA